MKRDKSQHVFSCVRSPQGDGLADEETKAGSNRRKVASLEAMVQWMIYLSLNDVFLEMIRIYPWRIHGAGIYANIWGILMVNVTILYIAYMDPMGYDKSYL